MLRLPFRSAAAAAFALAGFALAPAAAEEAPSLSQIVEGWAASGHADAAALAFTYWNDQAEVPPQCVVCHAGAGFRDFHGLDGTAAGSVDTAIAPGGVVDCDTCHAVGVEAIASITFPSGIALPPLPGAATCMTCHQGRSSGPTVAARTDGMAPDAVNAELSFLNPHYFAAAATIFGTEAKGLYEYPGQTYVGRFAHVPEAATCSGCHDVHRLEVRAETCVACHKTEALADIRATKGDFDGDGDTAEGIAAEIATLQGILAEAIGEYAARVSGTPIVYHPAAYPYFFADLNGNGIAEPEEAERDNSYKAWTPRLLAAAYNYQFVAKDPGSYAHNPVYALQALHDSIADLATAMEWQPPALARP